MIRDTKMAIPISRPIYYIQPPIFHMNDGIAARNPLMSGIISGQVILYYFTFAL